MTAPTRGMQRGHAGHRLASARKRAVDPPCGGRHIARAAANREIHKLTRPLFTRDGCLRGARLTLPLTPGIVAFGAAYGAAAVQKGISLSDVLLMSAVVYSGAAQMVALEVWQESWTVGGILAVMLVSTAISARMILMGASLQPWLKDLPRFKVAANLFLLTDANWLISMRYRTDGGRDIGVLFGAGVMLWLIWLLSCIPGYLGGSLLGDPKRFGLDLVLPIYFATMLVPLWKGARSALPWLVAAAVALAFQALVPGYMYIVAGALAGAATGGLIRARP